MELRRESAQAKGERIIGEELKGLKWIERDLRQRPKSDAAKLNLAARRAEGDDANDPADSRAPAPGQLEELKQQAVFAQPREREAQ